MGDVDAKAQKMLVGVDKKLNPEDVKKHLLVHAPGDKKELSEREGWQGAAGGATGGRQRLTALGMERGRRQGRLPCVGVHPASPQHLGGRVGTVLPCPEEGVGC